jgi:hypothetical protein
MSRVNTKEAFSSILGSITCDYSTGEQEHKGNITRQGSQRSKFTFEYYRER